MSNQLFVVERYDDTGTPGQFQPMPMPPSDVQLLCAVRVPADDVVLALVEGADEQSISAALNSAGWRVDRITPASWAGPDQEGRSCTTDG